MSNTLTCVYCGMEYPEGTPPYGAKILTDHIKVCEKHPMRQAETTIHKLRTALVGLVGVSTREELMAMEAAMRSIPVSDAEKAASINAIRALIETMDDGKYPSAEQEPNSQIKCTCPEEEVEFHPVYKGICVACGKPIEPIRNQCIYCRGK